MNTPPHLRTPHQSPHAPGFSLPEGACDTHFHIYEPSIALRPDRRYTPVEAGLENYRRMASRMGLKRGVVVTGSAMTSNEPSLAAIAAMDGDFKGLALVKADIADNELEALAAGGMTGFRISTRSVGGMGPDQLDTMCRRVRDLGWHVEIHLRNIDEVMDILPRLDGLPIPCSLDHVAYLGPGYGPGSREFDAVRDHLAGSDNTYLNIYSIYNLTRAGPPAYDDMVGNVRALVETRPDRIIWGSNWPHPAFDIPLPDEGDLVDFVAAAAPDAEQQRLIFTDNPARLYGWD